MTGWKITGWEMSRIENIQGSKCSFRKSSDGKISSGIVLVKMFHWEMFEVENVLVESIHIEKVWMGNVLVGSDHSEKVFVENAWVLSYHHYHNGNV